MKTMSEAMSRAVACITATLERLNYGDELTEQECIQVIDVLANLRALKAVDTTENKNDTNIDEILTEFNASVDDLKGLLRSMFDIVTEGKVPAESDMLQLGKSVDDLRNIYDTIRSIAMAVVSAGEMPEEGASATEFAEAVRNSASAIYRRKLDEIESLLTRFVSVRSHVGNYAAALQPFQREAEDLIAELNRETQSMEEIEKKIAGPKLFLEVVNCEDLDSNEGMDLLDMVEEFYPKHVQYGLAARKYFIPDNVEEL